MMNRKDFSGFVRVLVLAMGMLSVSSPLFEQTLQNSIDHRVSEAEAQNQKSGDETDQEIVVPAFQATLSTFSLHLDSYPIVLPDLPELFQVKGYIGQLYVFSSYSFFKTLFRHIISPNAP